MSVLLPEATGTFGEKPTLTFPATVAPTELEVVVLEPGDGDLVVNYLGQTWGGAIFDNSYDRGTPISFPIGLGAVIAGWDEGLVGRQIGSRLLLSIPPRLGYGTRGMPAAGIKGTDTLVFVVDIVGVN